MILKLWHFISHLLRKWNIFSTVILNIYMSQFFELNGTIQIQINYLTINQWSFFESELSLFLCLFLINSYLYTIEHELQIRTRFSAGVHCHCSRGGHLSVQGSGFLIHKTANKFYKYAFEVHFQFFLVS